MVLHLPALSLAPLQDGELGAPALLLAAAAAFTAVDLPRVRSLDALLIAVFDCLTDEGLDEDFCDPDDGRNDASFAVRNPAGDFLGFEATDLGLLEALLADRWETEAVGVAVLLNRFGLPNINCGGSVSSSAKDRPRPLCVVGRSKLASI